MTGTAGVAGARSRSPTSSHPGAPLLLAGSQAKVTKIGTPANWPKVLDPSVAVSLPDPTNTSEGLSAVLLIRTLLGNSDGTPRAEVVGTRWQAAEQRSTTPPGWSRA